MMIALPSAILLGVETWEPLPFGILPQSAKLNELPRRRSWPLVQGF
jgi:hypothetical protein